MKGLVILTARLVLTIILLFLTTAIVWSLVSLPLAMERRSALVPSAIGFLGGLAFFSLGWRLILLHVVSHELTHWIVAKLFLRRTGAFRVGTDGGSLAVERPNVFIALAPYCVPLYTLIWIGLYGVYHFVSNSLARVAIHVLYGGVVERVFYAVLGVTYAFHVVLTLCTLTREQPDLKPYGRTFSMALILFVNVVLVFAAAVVAGGHWHGGAEMLGRRIVNLFDGAAVAYLYGRRMLVP